MNTSDEGLFVRLIENTVRFWDWLFGSLHHSVEFDTLKLGLEKNQKQEAHSLINLYLNPLIEIKNYTFNKLNKITFHLKRQKLKENYK